MRNKTTGPNDFIPDWMSDSVTEDYLNDNVCLAEDPDEYYEKERERNHV